MNRRIRFAAALFAACVAPASAQEGATTLPSVRATQLVADCAHPGLPTQRQVGEWTGWRNFGRAYAARERLMAGIGRACQRPGVGRVQVVMRASPARGEPRFVAIAPGKR
jgi:hypothetical protein